MKRELKDGTEMYCSACESLTICKAISPKEADPNLASGRRYYMPEHEDVQWFRRGRICKTCGNKFVSGEIRESFIDELIELREALGEIKQNAEQYVLESESAAQSLQRLSDSLAVLRALKVYQAQSPLDAALAAIKPSGDDDEDDEWDDREENNL